MKKGKNDENWFNGMFFEGFWFENRKKIIITGVVDLLSFDDGSVIMDTVDGRLSVSGADLHILDLSLDVGDVSIEGAIDSFLYSDSAPNVKGGFFARMFR